MKKRLAVLLTALGMMVCGFVSTDAMSFELITKTETVVVEGVEIDIVKTADNFIVLFDSSSSMGTPYKGTNMTKIEVEKKILKDRNEKLPDLKFNAGLYTFTPKTGSLSFKALKPYYEMKPYNKAAFAKAIDQLPTKASGPTLLQQGLLELDKILAGLTGRTVVFVVTDGVFSSTYTMKKPKKIARDLATKYNVCFYVISNAPSQDEEELLKAVASINECSRVIPFEAFVERPGFLSGALFVLQERIVPRVVTIEKIVGVELEDIRFDYDRSDIRSEYYDKLNALGKFLRDNPSTYVLFAGFTDSRGSQEYNLGLSRRRAESVGVYLVERCNIDPERIVVQWYGEAAPVASNATEEGQSQNRRVDTVVAKLQ